MRLSTSSCSASSERAKPRASPFEPRARSITQPRLDAVGLVSRRSVTASSNGTPCSAASASPYAAASPIAGAPRTAIVRIASATRSTVSQRSQRSSAGSARWSRTSSAPPSKRRGETGSALLDEAGLLQVLRAHLGGGLLVQVHPGVQLLHDWGGQPLVDLVNHLLEVRPGLLARVVPDHERGVVGREHVLVVLEQDLVVALDLRVGGEHDRHVGLTLLQDLVAQVDRDGHELLELQPVDLLEP